MNENEIEYQNIGFMFEDWTSLAENKDEKFSEVLFSIADEGIAENAYNIIQKIMDSSLVLGTLAGGVQKTEKLQLVFSPEVQAKLTSGEYSLMQSVKDGMKAVAVDKNNKIRELGSVSIQEVTKNVSVSQLMVAMQGMAIQQQMQEIAQEMKNISKQVETVLNGQHADRIANYYSAEAIYREAMLATDEKLKYDLRVLCLSKLNDGVAQMALELKYKTNQVFEAYHKNNGKSDKTIKSNMKDINELFEIVHKANALKTAIYYHLNEYGSMAMNLLQYKKLLLEIIPNEEIANKLYMLDSNAKKLDGIWFTRANKLPELIDNAIEKVHNPENLYIEIHKEVGRL